MRDIHSRSKPVVLIGAAALNADNTPVGVDTRGFKAALIEISVGVGGITFDATNKIEFKLTHSDDDVTYTAVTADDVQLTSGTVGAGGIVLALTAAKAAANVTKVGYVGNKNFLKLLADFSGTHATATPIAASVLLTDALYAPVA